MSKFPLSPKLSRMIIIGKKVFFYNKIVWTDIIFDFSCSDLKPRVNLLKSKFEFEKINRFFTNKHLK